MKTGNKFTAGLVAGVLVGVAAGLLMAPKNGKETREMVSERSHMLKEGIEKQIRRCRRGEEASNNHVEVIG